ncbi:MAG: ferrous iron transport protein B [Muribaculaceae bacterium]|nr:ferrous iron transport protein B [Muribaculaceae bacterium]
MTLNELKPGETAVILKIHGHGAFRKRVIEMGFTRGRRITTVLNAPLHDPVKYTLMGYEVSLRRAEAKLIEVLPIDNAFNFDDISHINTTEESDSVVNDFQGQSHTINVALIGNPNCGKTSLFNIASGATEHVGNYSGVTVDSKAGHFNHNGYRFNIVDLPGTYSLSAYSPEELYVRRYLKNERPDIIVNVVDASNLERNLYLTTELIDMNRPMVIALNMYDELKKSGTTVDYKTLGSMIGVPIIPTVSKTGFGIDKLFDTIIDIYESRHEQVRHVHVKLGNDIEDALQGLRDIIKNEPSIESHFAPRYVAIKLMEHDSECEELIKSTPVYEKLIAIRDKEEEKLKFIHNDDVSSLIANEKYGFIAGALAETMTQPERTSVSSTHIIDTFVTSPLFGFPIFLIIMFFIFWATFTIGNYPMEWIESLVGVLADFVNNTMPDGPLKDLLANGVIGGVGGVIVFLPNILILYFFISFMEDSGYMARAAFIMDRLMHKIGLHGKSFIPLVMGFGCNVPAIMASRAIESKSSRIITILINPFMSCSARLPVYVLLTGTFFGAHATIVLMSMYIIGIFAAVVTAKLLRNFYFKEDETPFVMELPPYRLPTFKASVRHMWGKGKQYLQKMGGIILFASIIVWALNYFPLRNKYSSVPANDIPQEQIDENHIDTSRDSYLEMIGKTISPIMSPLGLTWRPTVALIAGIPAKEIVVSTLGVLYTGEEEIDNTALSTRLTKPSPATGKPDFTNASALAFMVFVLLYCPCIATLTAIVKETGHWGYGVFSAVYNTAFAWIVAFIVYHIALLF